MKWKNDSGISFEKRKSHNSKKSIVLICLFDLIYLKDTKISIKIQKIHYKIIATPQSQDPGVKGYAKTHETKVFHLYLYHNLQKFPLTLFKTTHLPRLVSGLQM